MVVGRDASTTASGLAPYGHPQPPCPSDHPVLRYGIKMMPTHYRDVTIQQYMVMPNHIHIIIKIGNPILAPLQALSLTHVRRIATAAVPRMALFTLDVITIFIPIHGIGYYIIGNIFVFFNIRTPWYWRPYQSPDTVLGYTIHHLHQFIMCNRKRLSNRGCRGAGSTAPAVSGM